MFGLFGLAFGNLNNGVGNSGLSCLNGNNGLSNANWNILARQARRIASYKGYFKHSDSKKIIKKLRLTDLFAAAAHAVGRYDGRMNNDKNYVWLPT